MVDDNATSRNILQDMLQSFSFEVTLAASGEEGLSELQQVDADQPYELVLMDWKMPGMDGIEASRQIKSSKTLSRIPAIILVTAYGREEIMRQSEEIGLDGFLIKPIGPSVLFDTIMHAFGEGKAVATRITEKNEEIEDLKNIRGARILLVEDNEINQQVAREILQGAGFVVTVANDGREGFEAARDNQFDVILMDIQMPVMDGYTATRKIREWEASLKAESSKLEGNELEALSASSLKSPESSIQDPASSIQQPAASDQKPVPSDQQPAASGQSPVPIIAMTAHAMTGDEQKSIQAGMNGHVTKPIDPAQLFAELLKWIRPDAASISPAGPEGLETTDPQPEPVPAEQNEDELPDSLPGFNLAAGLSRLMGNKRLYRKLLLDFGVKYGTFGSEIRRALDADDFDTAHSLVHNIKGLAGNLEATELQASSVVLEKLVKGKTAATTSAEELNKAMLKLEKTLEQALDAVHSLAPAAEEQSHAGSEGREDVKASIPPEQLKALVTSISEAAEMGDVTQIESIAGELKSETAALIPICERLIQMAQDFDFDGIQQFLLELDGL